MNKVIKNKERNTQQIFKPYVPQYKIWGVNPINASSSNPSNPFKTAGKPVFVKSSGKPKEMLSKSGPYVETQEPVILPNVGSSTWNQIEDDIEMDDNQLIDNNDFYSEESLGISNTDAVEQLDCTNNLDLQEEEYLLMVNGEIISTGAQEPIQREVKDLIFGEHGLFKEQIPIENIMVLKRVKIKMGVFIDG